MPYKDSCTIICVQLSMDRFFFVGEQGNHYIRSHILMNTCGLLPPLFAAQHELLHLPGRVLGQASDLDGSRALEMRQVLSAERDDLVFGHLLIFFHRDKPLGALPHFSSGMATTAQSSHRGGRLQGHRSGTSHPQRQ
jgi:hypothetical protein